MVRNNKTLAVNIVPTNDAAIVTSHLRQNSGHDFCEAPIRPHRQKCIDVTLWTCAITRVSPKYVLRINLSLQTICTCGAAVLLHPLTILFGERKAAAHNNTICQAHTFSIGAISIFFLMARMPS